MKRYQRKCKILEINISKEYGDRLSKFGDALPNIVDYSLGDIAHDMGNHIRETFLNGKALDRRTGETYDSTKGYKSPQGDRAWLVDFGVGIHGRLNYLHKWAGGARDFMTQGKLSYEAGGGYMRLVEENLERMERRMEVL